MPHRPPQLTHDVDCETAPCGGVPNVLDAVVRTILSQHTSDARARVAIAGFEKRFGGNYEAVRAAPIADVASAIAGGGLTRIKSTAIKKLIDQIHAERGEPSLEHLRVLGNDEIKTTLMRYSGVGLKTACCVLLLCLGRNSFVVDTHVLRLVKKLSWVPPHASSEQAHWHLDAHVPPELHYRLHILLVRHGKACGTCAARVRVQSQPPCPIDILRHAQGCVESGFASRPTGRGAT